MNHNRGSEVNVLEMCFNWKLITLNATLFIEREQTHTHTCTCWHNGSSFTVVRNDESDFFIILIANVDARHTWVHSPD